MGKVINLLLCSFAVVVVVAENEVTLKADRPYLRVKLSGTADLKCCFSTSGKSLRITWVKRVQNENITTLPEVVNASDLLISAEETQGDLNCGTLKFKSTQLKDTGLYQCWLNSSNIGLFTPGTYLQVYRPLEKTLNLSEHTKNKILTAEGILLLLCALLPAAYLLLQTRNLHELDKKKMKREEENIYQGLNLDDCSATYDQIERSQAHGPYQDVCNTMEEEEIQLEKP